MILLTGASGYLGRHVLASLAAAHQAVWPLYGRESCDLTDSMAVLMLFAGKPITQVIHCAARVPKQADDYADCTAAAESYMMLWNLRNVADCPIVLASSMTAKDPTTPYARAKRAAEQSLSPGDLAVRLPGLFGLPRTTGVIYAAAKARQFRDSFGPFPAMHVKDAAQFLVDAALKGTTGIVEPTYPTLNGATFRQRFDELTEQACAPSS